MKHRNISAILLAYGVPPIYGYKPLANIQTSLESAVLEEISCVSDFGERAMHFAVSVGKISDVPTLEPTAIPVVSVPWKNTNFRRRVIPNDLVAAESQSRPVHVLALKAVALHEQRSLYASPRSDLAAAVVIREYDETIGTGLVLSRSLSGAPKTILVKATNSVAEFPFRVSSDEVDLSLDAAVGFRLHRVFGLQSRPGFYRVKGTLKATAQLTASDHTVLPRN